MENKDLRLYARGHGVPLWRVAQEMKISEPTLTRIFRHSLTDEKKQEIKSIIDRIERGLQQ